MKLITTLTISLTLFAITIFAFDDCIPYPYCGERNTTIQQCQFNCHCNNPDDICNADGICEQDQSLYKKNGDPILTPMSKRTLCELLYQPRQQCLTVCDCIYLGTECRDGECYITREYSARDCD
eukprot:403352229